MGFDVSAIHKKPAKATLAFLEKNAGIAFDSAKGFWKPENKGVRIGDDAGGASAQAVVSWPAPGAPVLDENNGFFLSTLQYIDPQVIAILFAPRTADRIFGNRIFGGPEQPLVSWYTKEAKGETNAYEDYGNVAMSDVIYSGNKRQTHKEATDIQYGREEVERAGLAKVDIISDKREAAALNLSKFTNGAAWYGIAGKQLFGWFTDPNREPSITPVPFVNEEQAGSGNIIQWKDKTGYMIYVDLLTMKQQINMQAQGLISLIGNLKWKIGVATNKQVYFDQTNKYGFEIGKHLNTLFGAGNWEVVPVPEFNDPDGEGDQVCLFVEEYEGVRTMFNALQSRMIEGNIVQETRAWKQSRWARTAGLINRRPFLSTSMSGI